MKKQLLAASIAGLVFTGCLPDETTVPTPTDDTVDARFNADQYTPVESVATDLEGTWLVLTSDIDGSYTFTDGPDGADVPAIEFSGEIRQLCQITANDQTPDDNVIEHTSNCMLATGVEINPNEEEPAAGFNLEGNVITIDGTEITLAYTNNNHIAGSYQYTATVTDQGNGQGEANEFIYNLSSTVTMLRLSDSVINAGTASTTAGEQTESFDIVRVFDADFDTKNNIFGTPVTLDVSTLGFQSSSGDTTEIIRGDFKEIQVDITTHCASVMNQFDSSINALTVSDVSNPEAGVCSLDTEPADNSLTINVISNTADSLQVQVTGTDDGTSQPFSADISLSL